MIEPFRRTRTEDGDLRQVQDAVGAVFRSLSSKEIIDGQLISGLRITVGTALSVEHKLGRAITGWAVIGLGANAVVWDSQATNKTPARTLILNASASVTINLWVF